MGWAIKRILEQAGIEFLDSDGLRGKDSTAGKQLIMHRTVHTTKTLRHRENAKAGGFRRGYAPDFIQ